MKTRYDQGLIGNDTVNSSQSKGFSILKTRHRPVKFVSNEPAKPVKESKEVIESFKKKREEKMDKKQQQKSQNL